MKKILSFVIVCFISLYTSVALANFTANQDYVVLDKPVKTVTGDKVENGVDKAKASNAFKSFSVRIKVNKSKLNTVKYKTSGVPTFVVNGKYWVDTKHAGGEKRLFKVLDYLIQKESQ